MKLSNPIPRIWQWTTAFVKGHKMVSGLILVAVLGGAYGAYTLIAASGAGSHYVVQDAATGTIVATVSGTGQVSASNEVVVSSKASGNITSVRVVAGQAVRAGQLIATTDPGTSEFELESAKLTLERAQTSTQTGLTDKQSAYDTANANLTSAKEAGINQVTSAYGTMDQQLVSLGTLYTSNGYLAPNAGDNTQRTYVNTAQNAYADAKSSLESARSSISNLSRSSTPDQILSAQSSAYVLAKKVADAAAKAQTAVQYIRSQSQNSNSSTNDAAWTLVSGAVSASNALVTNLLSSQQSVTSAQTALASAKTDLDAATSNSGTLDIRSAQLTVRQKQDAYNDHFITAPFAGVVATVDGTVGTAASNGTKVATIVTKDQLASITLNEVDVAKVKIGQKVTLSFDAVDGLTITGTVAEIQGVGTVSQGVVDYGVKIAFDTQDARIKPGMTVNAEIQTAIAQDVVTVPSAAVKTANGETYVQVFTPPLDTTTATTQGVLSKLTPTRVPVTVGITDSTNTEIISGITAGQQVVTRTTSGLITAKSSAATATTRQFGGKPSI